MKPKTKKITIGIIIALILLLSPVLLTILLMLVVGITLFIGDIPILLSPNPPEPEIRYGEFPFEIVYSINGESFTEAGVVVCEYEGVAMRWSTFNYGGGKVLEWNTHIKGTEESELVIYEHQDGVVYCDVGEAFYYLGHGSENSAPEAKLYDDLYDRDFFSKARTAEEFKEKYGIEILSYKFSPPIENTFK